MRLDLSHVAFCGSTAEYCVYSHLDLGVHLEVGPLVGFPVIELDSNCLGGTLGSVQVKITEKL